ncbi:TAD2 [Candida pseudojiufengensis]|uniref:TAD2 n=1 Tax=Candida pseudojiufengensis TaxID=497109 RepID=UPI002224EC77|nr:TAD2 [Candida pseudojiufengensis]KAI5960674.1 TAD2 [Candida pseudojiufengensis]
MNDLTKHFEYMAIALFVGYKALLNNETPVSCIVVKDDKILSIGYNYTNISLNGTKHAEFLALEKLKDYNYKDLTLYVTVEPCIMCASYLRQLGIGKVYYGCGNDRFGGNGTILSIHKDPNLPNDTYESIGGICRVEAIQLLRNFYIQENEAAPNPKIKKNTNIEEKEFPPNKFNLTKDEFIEFYGFDRLSCYTNNLEITPILGKKYHVKNFLNKEKLKKVPYLESELGLVDDVQIDEFNSLFYEINDEGEVNYASGIDKFSHKKRRIS